MNADSAVPTLEGALILQSNSIREETTFLEADRIRLHLRMAGPGSFDANRSRSDGPIYEINIISSGTDRDVLTHLGTTLRTDRTYGEYRGPVDTFLIAGFDGVSKVRYEPRFLNWLKDRCGRSRRFGSICTGVSCGFTSSEILRRAFERRLGVTPRQYRASFGRARAR